MKRMLLRLALAAAVILALPNISAAEITADAAAVNSASAASATKLTNVRGQTVIKKNTVIAENEVLYVRSGGRLFINEGVTLTIKGQLKCADGGEIYVKGNIKTKENSRMSISGKMKILSTGCVTLGGKLAVNPTGTIKGFGTLKVENLFSDINCRGSVTAKIKAPKPVTKDGVTTVGGIIIANKKYDLPKDYGTGLDRETYLAYLKMKKASGYDMTIVSGFRSYEKQEQVFEYWCSIDGYDRAVTYSALPGQSEHQTGLALDISSLQQSYGETEEGIWLKENCWQYGFIIRYPKGKEKITGYMYEPWHVRYLGTSTAKLVYDSGLTLEEFLGIA